MSVSPSVTPRVPRITPSGLIQSAGLSAVVAGLLFILIQPLHPADDLASVTTQGWALIHGVTLAMSVFFLFGIAGIYARQTTELGWLGLVGYLVLTLALLMQAPYGFIEAFVQPLLATSDPAFVEGMLGLVNGSASEVSLGVLPTIWAVSGLSFIVGLVLFGIANVRAGIVSRWGSLSFAFGLLVFAPLGAALLPHEFQRLGALPVGVGLAWMGYSLWTEQRAPRPGTLSTAAVVSPVEAGAA